MTGPSQSIIARLSSGAQGAPVDATKRKEDRSNDARVRASSFSKRTYMMGTR
ncbi:hypothetical protein D3C87_2019910 [compost metagenome]